MFQASAKTTGNPDVLRDYIALLQHAPELIKTVTNKTAEKYEPMFKVALRVTPGRVVYPIMWTSDRQKGAFFATRGFGMGIPTPRTNRMVNAWRVVVVLSDSKEGASIELINDDPKRRYVIGEKQQRFHRITGWVNEQTVIRPIAEAMAEEEQQLILQAFEVVKSRGQS